MRKIFSTLLLMHAIVAMMPVHAAWTTTSDGEGVIAAAAPSAGHELALLRRGEAVVLRFSLPGGFATLDPAHCPTFQVDRKPAITRADGQPGCTAGPRRVETVLGQVDNGRVVSLALHRIMNGSVLDYRYLTAEGRYREVSFSLGRSLQSIEAALGRGVQVQPE